jgi:hypothetical protein
MRRLCGALVVLALLALVCLGATETLRNRSGKTASGVTITFSEKVRITGYDESVFSEQDPTGRADVFTFSGGRLANGGSFGVTWTPSSATVEDSEWLTSGSPLNLSGSLEPTTETTQYPLAGDPATTGALQGTVTRTIERGVLPFIVTFTAALQGIPAGATLSWDTDIYVDTDGNGDTEADVDAVGASLDLLYTENYNPTVKFVVKSASGVELGTWRNTVRNDFLVGEPVLLDGERVIAALPIGKSDVTQVEWTQQHMERMGFEYMTEYAAALGATDRLVTLTRFDEPGKYVFQFRMWPTEGQEETGTLRAWATRALGTTKTVGFMMGDIWNHKYDPASNSMYDSFWDFTDAEAQAKLQFLTEEGVHDILIMNQNAMVRTIPMPQIVSVGEDIHVIDESGLRMVFEDVEQGYIAWQTFVFGDPGAPDQSYWSDLDLRDQAYVQEYFRQYGSQLLDSARLAEELGLRSFIIGYQHPYLAWRLCDIEQTRPALARYIEDQWLILIDDLRAVFSGLIGCGEPSGCSVSTRIARKCDFIYQNFGGVADYGPLQGATSVTDLRNAYAQYVDERIEGPAAAIGKPVWFTFWAFSYEGAAQRGWTPDHEQTSYDSWREYFMAPGHAQEILDGATNPQYRPSFRDQVLLLEALMPELADSSAVPAIFSEYEFWRLLNFYEFTPATILDYLNLVTGSLQGKPGFEVFKLWASILEPNERNLYRRVRALPKPAAPGSAMGEVLGTSTIGDLPLLLEWADRAGVSYSTYDKTTTASAPASSMDARFGDEGWRISSLQGGLLEKGVVFSVEFAPDDHPSTDAAVEYAIRIGTLVRVFFRSGGATSCSVSPPSAKSLTYLSRDFYTMDSSSITIAIPESCLAAIGLTPESISGQPVQLQVIYRGETVHSFITCPGTTPLEVVGMRRQPGSTTDIGEIDWEAIPVSVSYSDSVDVVFSCDGKDQDVVDARFWNRDGCRVAAFSVGVSDAGLAARVTLQESDRVGQYGYIVGFVVGPSSLYMMLYPHLAEARLAADMNGQWLELGTITLGHFGVADTTVSAWFPSTMYAERFATQTLATSPVFLHLDYIEGTRRELFTYPGSGRAAWIGEGAGPSG